MSADDDVDLSRCKTGDDRSLLSRCQESGESLHPHRVVLESLGERLVVLLSEQRRRDEDRRLFAGLNRLERGPDGDLGLPVPDVTKHQPIHRLLRFHVGLDVDDGLHLVMRLLVRERSLHLPLPRGVRVVGVTGGGRPLSMQLDHPLGHRRHRLTDLGPLLGPVLPSHPGHPGNLATCVAANGRQLIHRDVEPILTCIGDDQVVPLNPGHGPRDETLETTDPVLVVDDIVALGQVSILL